MVDNNSYIPCATAAERDAKLGGWEGMFAPASSPFLRVRKLRGNRRVGQNSRCS